MQVTSRRVQGLIFIEKIDLGSLTTFREWEALKRNKY
jgi:hypothetical protein